MTARKMMTRKTTAIRVTIRRMMATAEHPTMVHLMADQTITDQVTRVLQVLEVLHHMQLRLEIQQM